MAEKVVLKKYGNRRLYDTEKSVYVTLDQVAEMIKQGRQVEAIDAKTDENVTAFVLTQIVLEEARKKNILLPVPLLHMIIQYGENVLEEFFEKYLVQTIKTYLLHKSVAEEQFEKWLDVGMDISESTRKALTASMPFQSYFDRFSDSGNKRKKKKSE